MTKRVLQVVDLFLRKLTPLRPLGDVISGWVVFEFPGQLESAVTALTEHELQILRSRD